MLLVLVIGRAGPFGGNHWCAKRALWCATFAEGRAIGGLLLAHEHLGTDAFGVFFNSCGFEAKDAFCIETGIGWTEAHAAEGEFSDAAPTG